jgi:hypothetical protein
VRRGADAAADAAAGVVAARAAVRLRPADRAVVAAALRGCTPHAHAYDAGRCATAAAATTRTKTTRTNAGSLLIVVVDVVVVLIVPVSSSKIGWATLSPSFVTLAAFEEAGSAAAAAAAAAAVAAAAAAAAFCRFAKVLVFTGIVSTVVVATGMDGIVLFSKAERAGVIVGVGVRFVLIGCRYLRAKEGEVITRYSVYPPVLYNN